MICIFCAARIPPGATVCPGCGADLSDYIAAGYQADLLFNEALKNMTYQRYSEASDLLCRACALAPDDIGMLDLRIRCEYLSGNKKRALELMTDLIAKDGSDFRMDQLNELVAEYDLEQADSEKAAKLRLERQTDRLAELIDRMDRSLESAAKRAAPVPAQPKAVPAKGGPAPDLPGGMPDFSQFSGMFPPDTNE